MVFKPQTFYGDTPETAADETNLSSLTEGRVAKTLARAADIDATNVAVTAVGETIVLSGTVAYPEEIAIAADIASRIAGVVAVDNRITIGSNDNTLRA
jgi:osmotically-inducible protein OsmY